MKNIKLQVPGTVANLVCGFDILGMALNEPFDEMEFKRHIVTGKQIGRAHV